MTAVLAGCGSNTFNVQNPPPPPPPNITVAYQPAPAASILINAVTPLTAVVSHDSSNSGVDWSLTCSNVGNCGSLSSLHTDSGSPTTYTPPASLTGNNQRIDIVAFATPGHTKNVLAPINITGFGNNLMGTYVLQAQGVDANGGPNYSFTGAINSEGSEGMRSGRRRVQYS